MYDEFLKKGNYKIIRLITKNIKSVFTFAKTLCFPIDTQEIISLESYGEAAKINGPTENCEENSATRTCRNQVFENEFASYNFI